MSTVLIQPDFEPPPTATSQVYIVRRSKQEYLGGFDYKDLNDNSFDDVAAYLGRLREVPQNRYDATKIREEANAAIIKKIIVFDYSDLNMLNTDILVEGQDDGSGNVTEVTNASRFEITNVKDYPFTKQVEIRDIA